MTLARYCQESAARLRSIETGLLEFHPQAIEHCRDEMGNVLDQLLRWKITPETMDESDLGALVSFRDALKKLQARADQGTNLCLGWRQLHLTAGYTCHGEPQFVVTESNTNYEG